MALRATVYKVDLQVNDLDRQVFATYPLALACHPSETAERMMVRLLAFALHASDGLSFGRGISSDEDATIWQHDLSGALRLWIEVGLPDERLLRKASGRADAVCLYTYGGRSAALWWTQNGDGLKRLSNVKVFDLPVEFTRAMAALAARNMQVQVTVQDGVVWLSVGTETLTVSPVALQSADAGAHSPPFVRKDQA
jgi:uncharacterized protein YaeQ